MSNQSQIEYELMLKREQVVVNFLDRQLGDAESPLDWPGDFHLENGRYGCRCVSCGKNFVGQKRRQFCRVCDNA